MSDEPPKANQEGLEDADSITDEELAEQERAMAEVLRPLGRFPASRDDAPRLLPGVQRKLRERSRSKFYGDGWSTSQMRASYGLVALVMLIIVAIAYFVLGPTALSS